MFNKRKKKFPGLDDKWMQKDNTVQYAYRYTEMAED
jgi:hypothetical protein